MASGNLPQNIFYADKVDLKHDGTVTLIRNINNHIQILPTHGNETSRNNNYVCERVQTGGFRRYNSIRYNRDDRWNHVRV